jgi:hypothetical protein
MLQNYLTEAYATLKKPIWLTEFAGSGTVAEQQTFLKAVIVRPLPFFLSSS